MEWDAVLVDTLKKLEQIEQHHGLVFEGLVF